MRYSFHPDALEEYFNAVSYYAKISPQLAESFIKSVESGINTICEHPKTWPIIENDARRCLINRFPFGIYYCIEDNTIMIYAVMHMSRHPDYWKKRI